MAHEVLDQQRRQAAKAAARLADAEALRLGQVSAADMARRNGAFSALDLSGARIVAIGPREGSAVRQKKP
jgi:hypothetical protein